MPVLLVTATVALTACQTPRLRPPPQDPVSGLPPATQADAEGQAAGTNRAAPSPRPRPPRPVAQANAPQAASPTPGAASAPSAEPPIRPGPLAAEQRWLTALFQGTPVRVSSEPDGAVRVELPADVAFEHGSTEPSPGLRAVLQHLGSSLQRQPTARLALGAPGPASAQRQIAMRGPLRALGLPPHRFSGSLQPGARPVVAMRLALAPSAIGRLRDRDLPVAPVASTAALRPPAIR
jgi:hypothetical protein